MRVFLFTHCHGSKCLFSSWSTQLDPITTCMIITVLISCHICGNPKPFWFFISALYVLCKFCFPESYPIEIGDLNMIFEQTNKCKRYQSINSTNGSIAGYWVEEDWTEIKSLEESDVSAAVSKWTTLIQTPSSHSSLISVTVTDKLSSLNPRPSGLWAWSRGECVDGAMITTLLAPCQYQDVWRVCDILRSSFTITVLIIIVRLYLCMEAIALKCRFWYIFHVILPMLF